ncbi:MAG TPA: hypothetical protein VK601_07725, partial [Kofleriaceae bacterium]|nr:hypothetical protein [Kofleriaceae bacterium]
MLGTILLSGVLAGAAIPGCSNDATDAVQPENTGQIGIELKLAPGLTLSAVNYTIVGPGGFSRLGTIDVSNSTTISAVIGGIPFGVGYQISLKATTDEGNAVCAGSATFDIAGPGTVPVALHVTCELQPETGSIVVNGSLNVCPRINGIDASPAEVIFGGTIALAATAIDIDGAPAPLGFNWTTTSGTLDGATTTTPSFHCSTTGLVTITLAASDGDPACSTSRSVDVVCSEPPPQTPIKHVIVLIGENRTFDHTFGTYVPKPGQTVANLVSKGIVNPDGTPGPNFALAAQAQAAPQAAYFISPDEKQLYAVLPGPSTSTAPSAQRTTAPPFQNTDQAALETDIDPADLVLLTTGATGLPVRVLDTRVSNAAALPDGPFRLTGPNMPYDAYTGDTI